jgi:hypothetical protein
LFRQHFVERLVDERQRGADAHRRAIRFEHARVTAEHGHARSDGGLGQIHWRDVALLQIPQRLGQLSLQRGEKIASRSHARFFRSRSAN